MTKEIVKALLENWKKYTWSLQGFGMLRLHLSDAVRVNIWDSRYRVRDVSMIHDHPWDFESLIVVGNLLNIKYEMHHRDHGNRGHNYHSATIKPGPGGGKLSPSRSVILVEQAPKLYCAGDAYRQEANEIHLSSPIDGTITVNVRKRVGQDTARVFWEQGREWVSAEPRTAEAPEIEDIITNALRRF